MSLPAANLTVKGGRYSPGSLSLSFSQQGVGEMTLTEFDAKTAEVGHLYVRLTNKKHGIVSIVDHNGRLVDDKTYLAFLRNNGTCRP